MSNMDSVSDKKIGEDGQSDRVDKVLLYAASLVEAGWTTGCAARDESGSMVDRLSIEATSFCVLGAIGRATAEKGESDRLYLLALVRLCDCLQMNWKLNEPSALLVWWNDRNRTQEEVATALRKAAARTLPSAQTSAGQS